MGPENPNLRYSVVAVDDEGRKATGNPAQTIDEALHFVHWQELDREEVADPTGRDYRPHT
jgi:hypothetical protein